MRFILTYDGRLPPKGTPADKNHIRLQLHPQLDQLWSVDYALQTLRAIPVQLRGQYGFIPIVTDRFHLVCQLEVTLLQPGDPGTVIHGYGGDLDNRLKTLFDSLGIPNANALAGLPPVPPEVATHAAHVPDTKVLLEDDSRITRLEVKTEKLLRPGLPDDVRIVMVVTVRPTRVTDENRIFLGGWIS
jgi:hypothetical protein